MLALVINVTIVVAAIIFVILLTDIIYIRFEFRGIMIFEIVTMAVANLIAYKHKYKGAWIKYLLMGVLILVYAVALAAFTYNVPLLVAIPILLSVRYYDRKFTAFIAIVSIEVFLLAYIIGANYGMLDLNFVRYPPGTVIVTPASMRLHDAVRGLPFNRIMMVVNTLVSNFLIKFLQLVIISVIAVQLIAYGRSLLKKQASLVDSKAKISAELETAEKIQRDALPSICPEFSDRKEFDLYATMTAAREVGGDFYDFFMIDEDRLCFLIADVSGKGIPAAMFMMTAKTMIKDYALTHGNTAEIFTVVNGRLCEYNETGMFATSWIGILDTKTRKLQFTNAGHNFPMLQRNGKPCERLEYRHGLFLAGMEGVEYTQSEITLEPGDRILLYTDGVTEAHNINRELYGEERLKKIMDCSRDMNGEETLNSILHDVSGFSEGVGQFDDITMTILKIK